jgi:hypothetical protein
LPYLQTSGFQERQLAKVSVVGIPETVRAKGKPRGNIRDTKTKRRITAIINLKLKQK